MSRKYSTIGVVAVAADSNISVIGSATVRPEIFYVALSAQSTAPADATITASVKHFTADGTGTAVTPIQLNANEPACVCTSKQTYTVEPTYAGIALLKIGMNQRSLFQFYAREGAEFVGQLAAGDGLGMLMDAFSTGTPSMQGVFHFME